MTDQTWDIQGNCHNSSLAAGEQLFATAPRVDVWLVLELAAPWGGKAFEQSGLSAAIKDWLNTALQAIPHSRLQLIKKSAKPSSDGIHFFVALARESGSALYRFQVADYQDLLALDIPAIAAEQPQYAAHHVDETLFLVCTNGKRDACCASLGLPVHRAFAEAEPHSTWQTNHTGGHRFAATGVYLPQGIMFGRLTPDEVPAFIRAAHTGQIMLDRYRGRSCYDTPVQAAEYFLRDQLSLTEITALWLVEAQAEGDDSWRVTFQHADGMRHEVIVQSATASFQVYTSSSDTTPSPVIQYHVVMA